MNRAARVARLGVAVLAVIVAFSSDALAQQPAAFPRIGQAPHSARETFDKLKAYLSDEMVSHFRLVSSDARTRTIVAHRGDIDTRSWSEWAFCKMSTTHLLDTLDHGAVTVTVKVDSAGKQSSYVRVDANFEGTFGGLGSNQTTQQCVSQGVLEQSILAAAGASQPGT